jgi:hypothetical protein
MTDKPAGEGFFQNPQAKLPKSAVNLSLLAAVPQTSTSL